MGANVGYYCCQALSMGKPVVAMEPIARNLQYLMRNIMENGWAGQAEIFPVAVGEKADVLKMWGGDWCVSHQGLEGYSGVLCHAEVPVLTLDRLLGDALQGRKALILVDVEGAEYAMLQGAMGTLRHEPRPIWMVEIGTTEHQPQGVVVNPHLLPTFDLFFAQGYTATTADYAQRSVDAPTVQKVAEGRARFETHNFVFR